MASSGNALVYAIIGFFAGIWCIYSGAKKYLLLQKINNTPTSKVQSAAIGLVELYGEAKTIDNLRSPISRKKCAFWKIVAQWYRSGKHGGWRKFYESSSADIFYLNDDTGKILVDPSAAQVEIPHDHISQGHITEKSFLGFSHKMLSKKALTYIDTLDEKSKKKFINHRYNALKLFEYYIAEGDKVYVLGNAENLENAKSDVAHENLIVRKGKHEKVMYISDSPEKKVVEEMRGSVYLHTFGGLVLSSLCLMLILIMLGVRFFI